MQFQDKQKIAAIATINKSIKLNFRMPTCTGFIPQACVELHAICCIHPRTAHGLGDPSDKFPARTNTPQDPCTTQTGRRLRSIGEDVNVSETFIPPCEQGWGGGETRRCQTRAPLCLPLAWDKNWNKFSVEGPFSHPNRRYTGQPPSPVPPSVGEDSRR